MKIELQIVVIHGVILILLMCKLWAWFIMSAGRRIILHLSLQRQILKTCMISYKSGSKRFSWLPRSMIPKAQCYESRNSIVVPIWRSVENILWSVSTVEFLELSFPIYVVLFLKWHFRMSKTFALLLKCRSQNRIKFSGQDRDKTLFTDARIFSAGGHPLRQFLVTPLFQELIYSNCSFARLILIVKLELGNLSCG